MQKQTVEQNFLYLIKSGEISAPSAAAIGYVDDSLVNHGVPDETITSGLLERRPIIGAIKHTQYGDIALIILPVMQKDVFFDTNLMEYLLDALRLCASVGIKVAALTGLLPSATGNATLLAERLAKENIPDAPLVTTGHAVTTACILLNLEKYIRNASVKKVAFLGLGSVGTATFRLFMHLYDKKVQTGEIEVLLFDVVAKAQHLTELQRLSPRFISIHTVEANARTCPEVIYSCDVILGATSVANVLDVSKLRSGTVVVDDSAPHCFDVEAARNRMNTKHDILCTEGGPVRLPKPTSETQYLPKRWLRGGETSLAGTGQDPQEIMGCTLSSLLTLTDSKQMPPTVGTVPVEAAVEAYKRLNYMGCGGCNPSLDDVVVPENAVEAFMALKVK